MGEAGTDHLRVFADGCSVCRRILLELPGWLGTGGLRMHFATSVVLNFQDGFTPRPRCMLSLASLFHRDGRHSLFVVLDSFECLNPASL